MSHKIGCFSIFLGIVIILEEEEKVCVSASNTSCLKIIKYYTKGIVS